MNLVGWTPGQYEPNKSSTQSNIKWQKGNIFDFKNFIPESSVDVDIEVKSAN